jgi:hypothetical protein
MNRERVVFPFERETLQLRLELLMLIEICREREARCDNNATS